MRFLRKRFVSKFLAVLLTLLIIESTVHSTITYALTTGPHQPEYTSYEEPGAKDMVNLLTGDFSFSLPILDVPGPEGGFSVPLTYNAGIGLEQEASWVGLGWTLNVGAITRQVNQYPDDASGETQAVSMKDLNADRGWNSNALGFGRMGWSQRNGHYGALSLLSIINTSYDQDGTTVGVAGFNFGKNAGFDPIQFAAAALSIASFGVSSIGQIAVQSAVSIGITSFLSFTSQNQIPNSPADGNWTYSQITKNGFLGIWTDYWTWLDQTRLEDMYGVLNFDNLKSLNYTPGSGQIQVNPPNLKITINGILQNIKIFKNWQGAFDAADVNYTLPNGSSYRDSSFPVALATDNYSVMAPGIAGAIKPYRLDVRALPTKGYGRFFGSLTTEGVQAYKVPFLYDGSAANAYYHHVGGNTSITSPTFYDGISNSVSNKTKNRIDLNVAINDVSFTERISSKLSGRNKIEKPTHVEWLSNKEIIENLPVNGFMDYFTGQEKVSFRREFNLSNSSNAVYSSSNRFKEGLGYIDVKPEELAHFPLNQMQPIEIVAYNSDYNWVQNTGVKTEINTTVKVTYQSNNPEKGQYGISVDISNIKHLIEGKTCIIKLPLTENTKKKPHSIGGYSITGINGITYHFALPTYEHSNYTWIENIAKPSEQNTAIRRDAAFASAWLLTGITGTDFVDRNSNGMIDENDWGYWVKFNYAKSSGDYKWAMPFTRDGATTTAKRADPTNQQRSYSNGYRESYYLNSIETRSHVALFLKENRYDALGANSSYSLRLNEIVLLSRASYKKLFLPVIEGGFGVVSDQGLANLTRVWFASDFLAANSSLATFISGNALKRIRFNYDYSLCLFTPNSNAWGGGKLTLQSVSMIGRGGVKILPDYKFEYAVNPIYEPDRWDGWGAYSSQGTAAVTSHTASPVDADGAAWSLTKITTPMGSTIEVNYERDDYSSISGNQIEGTYASVSKTWPTFYLDYGNNEFDLMGANNIFNVGDKVVIKNGYVSYECIPPAGSPPNVNDAYFQFGPLETFVSDVTSNKLILSERVGGGSSQCPTNNSITNVRYRCEIYKIMSRKKGGNIRVSSILTRDGDKQVKTKYVYTKPDGFSAGVIGYEPEFIGNKTENFQNFPGFPFTPVMYSQVTVLQGKLSNDTDYHSKQVFRFEVPHSNSVQLNNINPAWNHIFTRKYDYSDWGLGGNQYEWEYTHVYEKEVFNQVSDYTSKIGKVISIENYGRVNDSDLLLSKSDFEYTDQIKNAGGVTNNYQGIFSEGTLTIDRIADEGGATTNNTYYEHDRINRTTILKYPYELKKVVTIKDGLTTETENLAWDFITGLVVEKTQKSPLGVKTKSVTKLAYTVPAYAEMGSKAINANNKNMLGHDAANYTYLLDASGNSIGLLGASVQTYKSDWNNYRYLNGSVYADGVDGSPNVWRKHQNYVYKGSFSDLRSDGSLTFSPAKEFNFAAGATNSGWQKVGEATRFDHYSAALEGRDLNGIYSSSKKDIEGKVMLASASNAAYTEFAYSGAEDWAASGTGAYLGGEVAKGDGEQVNKNRGSEVHTGNFSLRLFGGKGFIFKTGILRNFKTYRASVWTNSEQGRLYYKVNGIETTSQAPQPTKKLGDWYLLEMEMKTNDIDNPMFEVGVTTANLSAVRFDDFRFQPAEAAVIANVYDPVTEQLTHTLDNQNMFTRYEYNDKGQLVRTYQETFAYGVKLISEKKVNYRRDFIDN